MNDNNFSNATVVNNLEASAPVDTRDPASIPAPAEPKTPEQPAEPAEPASDPSAAPADPTPADPPKEEQPAPKPAIDPNQAFVEAKRLEALRQNTTYKPEDTEVDFLDEYGNIDPAKFGAFMAQNNERVFNQALNASSTLNETERIEAQAWDSVHKDFPEITDGSVLENALKGARLQDVINGGDGDLTRIAKELVAPMRDAQIKAVEAANKKVEKVKTLDTATPQNATQEKVAVPLQQQLMSAIKDGDTQKAQAIRHAIRKERIFGTTK